MKEILNLLLQVQSQMRILHWQTTSYARHMAFGGFYDAVEPLLDLLVECYQGKYGRIYFEDSTTLTLKDISDDDLDNLLDELNEALSDKLTSIVDAKDTDLLNIRDEIIAEINKLKYLLTLE